MTARRWQTLENVCSKSRQLPPPILRVLVASHLVVNGHFRLEQLECYFHCRPRTLSAGHRQDYHRRFETLFKQPYQVLFQDGVLRWSSTMGERGTTGGLQRKGTRAAIARREHFLPTALPRAIACAQLPI